MCTFWNLTDLKPAYHCGFGIILSILGVACVSTEKTADASKLPPVPTHFVLDPGLVKKGDHPLPDMTPVFVKIFSGKQLLERKLAYKMWDFNKDGQMDMIEYLDAHAKVTRRAYDLNGDGRIDREEP